MWRRFAGLLAVFVGFFLNFAFLDELRTSLQSGTEPVPVTCASLSAAGPPQSPWVTLTEFQPYWEGIFATQDRVIGQQIYVPLVPRDTAAPVRAQDVRVIAQINRVGTEQELERLLAGGNLTGLVRSRGEFYFDQDSTREIPGLNVRQCWPLAESARPRDLTWTACFSGLWILVFALGLVVVAQLRHLPADVATQVTGFMSPVLLIVSAIPRLVPRLPNSPRVVLSLLAIGGVLSVSGGLLLWHFLYSIHGGAGSMLLGEFLLGVGLAFLMGTVLPSGRRTLDSAPVAAGPATPSLGSAPVAVGPSPRSPGADIVRRMAVLAICLGLGLALGGLTSGSGGTSSPSVTAGSVGFGVALAVLGVGLACMKRPVGCTSSATERPLLP